MKNATAFALAFALSMPSWGGPKNAEDDEFVSTEHLKDPFGETAKEEKSADETESHVRIFPLVKYDREGEDTNLKVIHAPFVALFKAKEDDYEKKTEIVDIPFFKLAQTKSNSDGEFDNKFVKLPIVGSLFRHTREGNKEKIRFLIFSHTRKVDPAEYGNPDRKKKSRRELSRSNVGGRDL